MEELENYFLGELSEQEKILLFDKIQSDRAYEAEFIRLQNTIALTRLLSQNDDRHQANLMLKELNGKIKKKTTRRKLWKAIPYAAAFALLIVNGWLLNNLATPPLEEPVLYTTIEVPKGQRVCMTLLDGTEAWFSPRSVIKIPNDFNKERRLIELDGEGYFSVKEDTDRPFIVETKQHAIKVVGTRFNVMAYSESPRFETDLLQGKVEVSDRSKPEEVFILNPGERISLVDNQLVKSVSIFNNDEYLRNGIFIFSNRPFGEVLEYLSLWYHVSFDIKDPAKKGVHISGKFRQSDEVKVILRALQDVFPFKFQIKTEELIEIN